MLFLSRSVLSPFLCFGSVPTFLQSLLAMAQSMDCEEKDLPAWQVRIKTSSPRTIVSRRTETAILVILGTDASKLLKRTWSFASFIGHTDDIIHYGI